MSGLGFKMFDTDNHYYETTDAFTRHMDPRMAPRAIQWAEIDGETRMVVGGKIFQFFLSPTNDPTWKPGVSREIIRGNNPEGLDWLEVENDLAPSRPEFRNRDARLALMDQQGIEGIFSFPSLGMGIEQALSGDPEACMAAFQAFNRWLDEDWGFDYDDRIYAAPYISLLDPDGAIKELEWALERGARIVTMRPGPIAGPGHNRSPGDPIFDGFWARVNEADIVVGYHGADTIYHQYLSDWGQSENMYENAHMALLLDMFKRTQRDTFVALICHGVFKRFPNLRILAVENGSDWVPSLLQELSRVFRMLPQSFTEDPAETFLRHCWMSCTPFLSDDLPELREQIGVDRILMGSDYPHPEGLENPADFVKELDGFGDDEIRMIMRENGLGLVKPSASPTL